MEVSLQHERRSSSEALLGQLLASQADLRRLRSEVVALRKGLQLALMARPAYSHAVVAEILPPTSDQIARRRVTIPKTVEQPVREEPIKTESAPSQSIPPETMTELWDAQQRLREIERDRVYMWRRKGLRYEARLIRFGGDLLRKFGLRRSSL